MVGEVVPQMVPAGTRGRTSWLGHGHIRHARVLCAVGPRELLAGKKEFERGNHWSIFEGGSHSLIRHMRGEGSGGGRGQESSSLLD